MLSKNRCDKCFFGSVEVTSLYSVIHIIILKVHFQIVRINCEVFSPIRFFKFFIYVYTYTRIYIYIIDINYAVIVFKVLFVFSLAHLGAAERGILFFPRSKVVESGFRHS